MNYNFSFFNAPISNKKPNGVVILSEIHRIITKDVSLKQATQKVRNLLPDERAFRAAKQRELPYFTPGGVFSYCNREGLLVPSGLFVVDIDHLESAELAADLRDRLFQDPYLSTALAFVSPGATGVKLLLPYRLHHNLTIEESLDKALTAAWSYIAEYYGVEPDKANRDISRACFLCHDEKGLFNG